MVWIIDKEIKSLKKFFKRLIYSIKNRKRLWASKETIKERREICRGCDLLSSPKIFTIEIPIAQRCSECGCFYKTKTKFDFEECPVGKWKNNYENV